MARTIGLIEDKNNININKKTEKLFTEMTAKEQSPKQSALVDKKIKTIKGE